MLAKSRIEHFVAVNITGFHAERLSALKKVSLKKILERKNPYLFRAKNLEVVSDLVSSILDATLSSSEETIFGRFLEELAVFVASEAYSGQKSSSPGVDLDFVRGGVRYLVSVKSGVNWGNSSQKRRLQQDLLTAVRVVRQGKSRLRVEAVEGCCYGRGKSEDTGKGYHRIVGQEFWSLISGNAELYKEIIEPIGRDAKKHNTEFKAERDRIVNLFSAEFSNLFCTEGRIDWEKLVQFNSGRLKVKFAIKNSK